MTTLPERGHGSLAVNAPGAHQEQGQVRTPEDITIRPLFSRADYDACVALQEETWGEGFNERVPSGILKLSQQLGGVASGAFDVADRLAGFVFGMSGVMNGRVAHWSDMLAVRADARDRGIGEALKWHQRELLLQRGIYEVYWTFDPLEARNAWLNFSRLGAVASKYVRNFYDASDSPLHRGLATDRLIVTWILDSERVRSRSTSEGPPGPDPAIACAPIVNPGADSASAPESVSLRREIDAEAIRIAIPANLQRIKRTALGVALQWQASVREAFEHYFALGYEVTDVVRDGDARSYVLRRR